MADLPHLLLPAPVRVPRRSLSGFGSPPRLPGYRRQGERLGPSFENLERARPVADLAPGTAEPEELLVLETVGRIDDLIKAVRRIPGMDWLGDIDRDDLTVDQAYFPEEAAEEEAEPGRLYMVMANQAGIGELLRLWRIYLEGGDAAIFPYGLTRWRDVFSRLNDIRRWGSEDRVRETGLDQDLDRRAALGQQIVGLELELWFRNDVNRRREAAAIVAAMVVDAGGHLVRESEIEGAAYHAVLATVPIDAARAIVLEQHPVVRAPQIMYVRPVGQTAYKPSLEGGEQKPDVPQDLPAGTPVVALLDGLPLTEHGWLAGRLSVDDPENWEADYLAAQREHGTAMASLIAHGEIGAGETPLTRPIYVRPVMRPVYQGMDEWREQIPDDELPPDLMDRAVTRLFGTAQQPGVAPSVKVICHAMADPSRVFDSAVSAWGRVLDYLSWRYKVLFVVSAGNHGDAVPLDPGVNVGDAAELERTVLAFVSGQGRTRGLLAPAEAINVLTIGALHGDESGVTAGPPAIDPFDTVNLPSPMSGQGRGFRRSVKPDIALPGGRQVYRASQSTTSTTLRPIDTSQPPGQATAAPPVVAGDLGRIVHSKGTSNSTALAARTAASAFDVIEELRAARRSPPPEFDTVIMKAMLAHATSLDGMTVIQRQFGAEAVPLLTRLSGYGRPQLSRMSSSDDDRVVLIGWGSIGADEGDRFEVPIPIGLGGAHMERAITVTLGWFSPVNPRHRAYRRAQLWFDPYWESDADGFVGPLRLHRLNGDWQGVRRGTLQHETFIGTGVIAIDTDTVAHVQVNCRSETGDLDDSIPYGLMVTVEARSEAPIGLYQQIEQRLAVPVVVGVGGP